MVATSHKLGSCQVSIGIHTASVGCRTSNVRVLVVPILLFSTLHDNRYRRPTLSYKYGTTKDKQPAVDQVARITLRRLQLSNASDTWQLLRSGTTSAMSAGKRSPETMKSTGTWAHLLLFSFTSSGTPIWLERNTLTNRLNLQDWASGD